MHPAFNLNLMLFLFLLSELFLLLQQLHISVISELPQRIRLLTSEPGSHMALDEESDLFTLLFPHLGGEIRLWVDYLVLTIVYE